MAISLTGLMLAAAGASAAAGAPGALDRSFGRAGVATIADPFLALTPEWLAEQPDGGILVGARAQVPGGDGPGFVVARLTRAGQIDRNFGRVDSGLGWGAAAILPDGGFAVAGLSGDDPLHPDLVLARHRADGSLVGRSVTRIATSAYAGVRAVAVQPGGALLVAIGDGWVYRFSAAGALDAGFGTGGRAHVDPAARSAAVATMAVQPDGGILVAGQRSVGATSPSHLLLARLLPDGERDPRFGGSGLGRVVEESADWREATAMALEPDGSIVALGSSCPRTPLSYCSPALWRFRPDGTGSTLTRPLSRGLFGVTGLALDDVGAMLVSGGAGSFQPGTASSFTVRLGTDGRLDRGFGRAGRVLWTGRTEVSAPLVLRDGRIVVALREDLGRIDTIGEPTDVARLLVARLFGGYDRRGPAIRVRRACADGRLVVRLRITDRSSLRSLRVSVDGRRIAVKPRKAVRLTPAQPGRLRVVAVDQAGNRSSRTAPVRRCPVSA